MRATLTIKIGFLLAVLTAGLFLALGAFYRFLTVTDSAPDIINIAGRQRMLSERFKSLADSVSRGNERDREALGKFVRTFDRSLDALEDGGEVDGSLIPPAPFEISNEIATSRRLWTDVKPALLLIAKTASADPRARHASDAIQPKLDVLVKASNDVVIAYVGNLRALRSNMFRTLLGICGADCLILFLGLWLTRRYVSRPVRLIKEGALRIRAGDFAHPVPVITKDELALLAETFNDMASEVGRLLEAIGRSEERSRALVDNSHEGVVLVSRDRRFLYLSRPMQTILGYAQDELIGRSTTDIIHREDQEVATSSFEKALANPGTMVDAQLRLLRKDGTTRHVELVGTNRLDDPAIRAVVTNCRDITERMQLEDELRQAHKMEAVGRLAGGVAHDFNNLLTVIIGHGSLALADIDAEDPLRSQIGEILKAAERAALLTRQLLAFSRRQILQPVVLDLNTTVTGIESMLRRLIGEDIELVLELDPDCGNIRADPGQIEQIIVNLAVNARQAMPKGGILKIRTGRCGVPGLPCQGNASAGQGACAVLCVADTGIGMDAATVSHIFEPFFTTKAPGEGTGLGLATVYGIVKQSGGHIAVQSEPGKGTTFWVYLRHAEETV